MCAAQAHYIPHRLGIGAAFEILQIQVLIVLGPLPELHREWYK